MTDSPDFSAFWHSFYQKLLSDLVKNVDQENFLQRLTTNDQLQKLISDQCQQILQESSRFSQEELGSIVQLIALLEEKMREQQETITHLLHRIERLEEDNLQTRIEAAKHHLDSMEKLALLQQKVNSR